MTIGESAKSSCTHTSIARARELLTGPQMFATGAQVMRSLLLALYLLLSTRLLGPAGYGSLAAAVALAVIGSTIVGMGSGVALVRSTVQEPNSFPERWGETLAKYTSSSLVCVAIYVAAAGPLLGHKLEMMAILYIAVAELVLNPLCLASLYAFLACDRTNAAGIVQIFPAIGRLSAAAALWLQQADPSVLDFAKIMMIGATGAAVAAVAWAWFALPRPNAPQAAQLVKPNYSWMYAFSNVTMTLSTEVDKAAAFRLSVADDAGLYSASSRIVSALTLPYGAAIQSRSRHLFSLGSQYSPAHRNFIRRYGLVFVGYGLSWTAVLVIFCDHIASFFGGEFQSASPIIALIAWWIPLNGLRQLFGAVLTATHLVGRRIAADLIASTIFLIVAAISIPAMGVRGAAMALICSEAIGLIASVLYGRTHWRKSFAP